MKPVTSGLTPAAAEDVPGAVLDPERAEAQRERLSDLREAEARGRLSAERAVIV